MIWIWLFNHDNLIMIISSWSLNYGNLIMIIWFDHLIMIVQFEHQHLILTIQFDHWLAKQGGNVMEKVTDVAMVMII